MRTPSLRLPEHPRARPAGTGRASAVLQGVDLPVVDRTVPNGLAVVVDAPAEQEPVAAVLGPVFVTQRRGREPFRQPCSRRQRPRRLGSGHIDGRRRGADGAARALRSNSQVFSFRTAVVGRTEALVPHAYLRPAGHLSNGARAAVSRKTDEVIRVHLSPEVLTHVCSLSMSYQDRRKPGSVQGPSD